MEKITKSEAEFRAGLLSDIHNSYEFDLRSRAKFTAIGKLEFTCKEEREVWLDQNVQLLGFLANGSKESANLSDSRVTFKAHKGLNVVEFAYEGQYNCASLGGLQSFTNKDEVYVYCTPIFSVPAVFPTFAQPDLKACVSLKVMAPLGWTAASNGKIDRIETDLENDCQTIHFRKTPPLSPYLWTMNAGHFQVSEYKREGRPPQRILCRNPFIETYSFLHPIIAAGIEIYEYLFKCPYPFDKLDCVFAPHTSYAGMESAACIVFSEQNINRDLKN